MQMVCQGHAAATYIVCLWRTHSPIKEEISWGRDDNSRQLLAEKTKVTPYIAL